MVAGNGCQHCPAGWYRESGSKNGSRCDICPVGYKAHNNGSSSCEICPRGKHGPSPGGDCIDCIAGRYQDNRGDDHCKVCGIDTYSTEVGATTPLDCIRCEKEKTTGGLTSRDNEAACRCRKGLFYTADHGNCEECPVGADCAFLGDGMTLNQIVPQNGFWRTDENSTIFADCATSRDIDAEERCCPVDENFQPEDEGLNETACACEEEFPYLGGLYHGCAETPDWPGNTWCYVIGTGVYCEAAQKSVHPGETRRWRTCSPTEGEDDLEEETLPWTVCSVSQLEIFFGVPPNATKKICREGHAGPLCMGCTKGYVAVGDSCLECPAGSSLPSVVGLISGVLALFFLFLLIYYKVADPSDEDKDTTGDSEKTKKNSSSVKIFVASQASDREDSKSTAKDEEVEDEEEDFVHKSQNIYGHVKIIITFCQVLSSMPLVMVGVQFPDHFKSLSSVLNSLNLDVMRTFMSAGCRFSLSFHLQFWVHVCIPPILMIVAVGAYKIVNMIRPPKPNHLKYRSAEMFKVMILVILLLYPGMATRLFNMLNCMSIEGIPDKEFLLADMDVQCWTGQHKVDAIMAVVFISVYIVGVPMGMFLGMFVNRKAMWDRDHPDHDQVYHIYGGLYDQVSS